MALAGFLPELAELGRASSRYVVDGRLQSLTNKQLLTRLQTKKMARDVQDARVPRSAGMRESGPDRIDSDRLPGRHTQQVRIGGRKNKKITMIPA